MAYVCEKQDELVWEFFGRRRAGFFLEVGANHPTQGSQTWLLEQNGWRGILVEPQATLAALLAPTAVALLPAAEEPPP